MRVVRTLPMPPYRYQTPAFGSGSISQRGGPYPDLTEEQIEAIRKAVEASKPPNFKLTPISEPGW